MTLNKSKARSATLLNSSAQHKLQRPGQRMLAEEAHRSVQPSRAQKQVRANLVSLSSKKDQEQLREATTAVFKQLDALMQKHKSSHKPYTSHKTY